MSGWFTAKFDSTRVICLIIMIVALCWAMIWFVGTPEWQQIFILFDTALLVLLGNISNRPQPPAKP